MSRVYKRGKKWWIDYSIGEKEHRRRIRKPIGKIKEQAIKALAKVENEKYFNEYGTKQLTIMPTKEVFQLFLEQKEKRTRKRTIEGYRNYLKFWGKYHKSEIFAPLSQIEIQKALNDLHDKKLSNRTLNGYLGTLKQLYKYAVDFNLVQESPAEKVKRFPVEPKKTPRFFTREEIGKILSYNSPYNDAFIILLNTGMRRNALRFLEWEDIDFEKGLIYIRVKENFKPKSGKERVIPMNDESRKVLEKRWRNSEKKSGYIFCYSTGNPIGREKWRAALKKILKKANIKDATIHTFRHTFASWLVMKGVDILTVSELLGHADIKTTQIYAHLAPEHIKNAIEKL